MSEDKALGPEIPVATGKITVICGRWGKRERKKRRDRKGGEWEEKKQEEGGGGSGKNREVGPKKEREGCINRSCFQLITAATLIHH